MRERSVFVVFEVLREDGWIHRYSDGWMEREGMDQPGVSLFPAVSHYES